jgi:hypothetical protein
MPKLLALKDKYFGFLEENWFPFVSICTLFVLVEIETFEDAFTYGWRVTVRCAGML